MVSVFAVGATLLGVGASLAAILVVSRRSLRTEMAAVETRLGKRIDDTKTELRTEITAVETRLGTRIDRLADRVTGLDSRLFASGGLPLGVPGAVPPDAGPGNYAG